MSRAPERPVAFVNIGGVANVTWVGRDGALLAFDCGPGNALMDDWAMRHTGQPVDVDGALARSGTADEAVLRTYLLSGFLERPAPKSRGVCGPLSGTHRTTRCRCGPRFRPSSRCTT